MKRILFWIAAIITVSAVVIFMNKRLNKSQESPTPSTVEPMSTGSIYSLSPQSIDELSAKGKTGDVDAAYRLYQYYSLVLNDRNNERYWLELAAKAGKGVAQYNFSSMLNEENNLSEAMKWALAAKKLNHPEAQKLIEEIERKSKGAAL
jgi:TPR repeat protein